MANIQKRKFKKKTTYAVLVRRKGFRTVAKSFDALTEAKKWARNMESKLDRGDYSDYTEASKLTLGDLFNRYIKENKHKNKKQWRYEEYRKDQLLKDIIGDVDVVDATAFWPSVDGGYTSW
jgi:hypothetical protein